MIGNKLAFSSRGGKTSCSLFCLRPRDVTNSELLDHVAHWAICDLLLVTVAHWAMVLGGTHALVAEAAVQGS